MCGGTDILQLHLKCLSYGFFSVFFLTLTWLFASGVQSFNVCVCMCSSMLFSPSHSIWSSYIRDTYVYMCVIWTLGHRAFLEGFYKLFTNKIHTFSIFLSLPCTDDHSCVFSISLLWARMLFRLHIKLQHLPESVCFCCCCFSLLSPKE